MIMRITDLLMEQGIALNGAAQSKQEVIHKMVDLMEATGKLADRETYEKAVFAREEEGTTGIGEGIAIPHAKTDAVKAPGLAAMVLKDGVDYASLDGQPVHLIFLIAAPNTEDNVHLDVLARLSTLLMDDDFRKSLLNASTKAEFLQAVDRAEQEKFQEEGKKEEPAPEGIQILAVTACPTGIAHTYMAAESLEQTAKEMGVSIKVETDGSGGTKNRLTAEEIANCQCIIVAADKNVEMDRFDGKPVLITGVANGINKAKELIEEGLSGQVPVYQAQENKTAALETEEHEGAGRRIYKHLMNGVSHMLPFVVGGGILIALSYLFDAGNAGTEVFGTGTPIAAFLNQVGNVAFGVMFPILAGFIAMSIGDRPGLMIGFAGGLIAVNGNSGFFGALIAGFVGGYIIVLLRKLFNKLPRALEGTKPVLIYPVLGLLLIGAFMTYIINPPVAWFNEWLYASLGNMGTGSRVVFGLILGGMMSIDFGGPLNKAAYLFGTASLATGGTDIMAAVMIGGMVPPIAIALCTTFFKNRFTKKERQTTVTNYIMGAVFITEGAIPFAASDPIRVIPACAIGSAVAGALSMLFGCGSPAPHGGLFIIGIMENPLMFLLSLLIGAVVGMFLLAIFKKPVPQDGE